MGALVAAGKITKLFGDNGEVVISLYDTFPVNMNTEKEPLFVRIDSLTVPLFLHRFERRGQSAAIAGFDDIDTIRRAEYLIGSELFVRETAPVSGQQSGDDFYMEDFIGFKVNFKGLKYTGTIEDFIESDNNPLFTILVDGKEVLVPASNDFIVKFSVKRKEITLTLPEGLLELYL